MILSYTSFVFGLLVGFGAGLVLCGFILHDLEQRVRDIEREQ